MNTKEYDFGNFETDDFDFNDPFQEPDSPKKDRSPVEDVVRGGYAGFKETITDTSFQTNVLRKALPEGYGAAFDTANDVTDKGIGLYNQVTNDLRPAIVDLKRMGRRAKGMLNTILPDSVSLKLDEILAEEKQMDASLSKDEMRQQSIASELAPIFQAQAEEKKDDKAQDLMSQVIASKRHETNLQVSQGIRDELTKQNAYQDNVTMKWQRKMLELKLKHFFVAKDHYELFKLTQEETLSHFRSIVKNTGLPEAVKIKNSELALQLTKEKLVGKAQDKFSPMAKDFLNIFTDNVSKRLKEKVDEFKDAISTASFAGDMLEGMDLEELGISKTELGAQMGAETGTRKFGEWIGKKFAPILDKNEKVKTLGNKLLYGSENYTKILREALEERNFTSGTMNMLQEAALDALRNRRESKVGYDELANSTEHADFDNLTRKSIIEVIPGWLSKIWHGMTGRQEGEVTFDHRSNKFMGTDELAKGIEMEAVRGTELDRLKEINKEIISTITDNDLSEEVSGKVEEMLLRFARDDREFDVTKLVNGDYLDKSKLSSSDYDELADSVYAKLGLDIDGKIGKENVKGSLAQVEANRGLRKLRESMPNTYEIANVYANTANREALRGTGLVEDRDGVDHVNENYLFDRYREHNTEKDRANKPFRPVSEAKPWATGDVQNNYSTQLESDQLVESIDALIASMKERSAGIETLGIDYDRIEDIEKTYSNAEKMDTQIDLLNEIRDVLIDLPNHIGTGEGDGTDRSRLGRAKEWIKGKGRGAKGMLGKAFDLTVKKPWQIGKKLFGNPFAPITGAVKMAGKLGGAIRDKVMGLKPMDLYFKDNLTDPIIEKVKLEAGFYRDALTGKVIKKLSDIRGAVKDPDGNWVITPDRFKEGLFNVNGKRINLGKISTAVLNFMKKGVSLANPFKALGVTKLIKSVGDTFNKLPAIYVKGETIPRILPIEIEQGIIVNAKGKTVKAARDLNSAIFKNGKEIIKETELKDLADKNGKKIKGLRGKALDMVTGLVGGAAKMLMSSGKTAFNLAKKGAGKVADVMQGSLGWLTSKASGAANAVGNIAGKAVGAVPFGNINKRIYALLLKYFAFKGLDVKAEQESMANSFGSNIGSRIKEGFGKIFNKENKEKFNDLKGKAKDKYDDLRNKSKDRFDDLKGKSKDKYDDLKGKAKDKFDKSGIRDKAAGKFKDLKDSVTGEEGLGKKMANFMDIMFSKFKKFRKKENDDKKKLGLKDRLKNEAGDIRDRVGSYANIMKERLAKRKAEREEKKKQTKEKKGKKDSSSSGGLFGGILSLLSGSMGFLGTIAKGIMGIGSIAKGIFGLMGGAGLAGTFMDMIGLGGGPANKGKSWTSRLWSGAKRAVPWLARGAVTAAPAIASGAASAGTAIAAGASTAAAVVFSPVVLTAAALGGIGYLTYKYLDEKKDELTILRMAQYGIPDIEHDLCVEVNKLEQLLKPFTNVNDKGATITGKIPYEQIPEIFGWSLENKVKIRQFNVWFEKRFKPVYLRNMFLLKTIGKSDDLSNVFKAITGKDRISFAKASILKETPSPYNVNANPFEDQDIEMDTGIEKIEEYLADVVRLNKTEGLGMGDHIRDARNGRTSRVKQKKAPTYDLPDDGYSAGYGKAVLKKSRADNDAVAKDLVMKGRAAPLTEGGAIATTKEMFAEQAAERRRNSDNPKVRAAQRKADEMRKRGTESSEQPEVSEGAISTKDPEEFRRLVSERRRNSDDPKVRAMQRKVDKMRARSGNITRIPANDGSVPTPATPDVSEKDMAQKIAAMGGVDTSNIYKPSRGTVGEYGRMVVSVAMLAGIEPDSILALAKLATNFNPKKRIGARSGMYLMDAATFRKLMDKHADNYDIKSPDILNPTHATIAVAEFLKVSIKRLRSALGREPTAAENLSAMMYGTDETIRLLLAKDDADVTKFIKPKTTADKDRLKEKMTKKEFFDGLSSRLDQQKAATMPQTSTSTVRPSYVSETAKQFDLSSYTEEDKQSRSPVQEKVVQLASKRAEEQRQRVKDKHLADSSQSSVQSAQELQRINSVLNQSNRYHKETVSLLKELLKSTDNQTKEVSKGIGRATTQPVETPSVPETTTPVQAAEQSVPLDQSKINMRRGI